MDLTVDDAVNNSLQSEAENPATPPEFHENGANQNNEAIAEEQKGNEEQIDYEALALSDINELRGEFAELSALTSLTELDNPVRYGALRDLGLTPSEAYLATRKRRAEDNRSHLRPTRSVARGASPIMTEAEMSAARELFSEISDAEIRQLYKRVTK
jgi:HEAT repeat protein